MGKNLLLSKREILVVKKGLLLSFHHYDSMTYGAKVLLRLISSYD